LPTKDGGTFEDVEIFIEWLRLWMCAEFTLRRADAESRFHLWAAVVCVLLFFISGVSSSRLSFFF
jgi:hypothetical protein